MLQCPGTAQDVRHMAQDLGLATDRFQRFRDFDVASPTQLARNLDRAERKFDVMDALGAPLLLVCSNLQPDALGDPEALAAQFRQLAERAGRRGRRIACGALTSRQLSPSCPVASVLTCNWLTRPGSIPTC